MRANPALRGRSSVFFFKKIIMAFLDAFAEDVKKDTLQKDESSLDHMRQQPLPQGWSEKIDHQTGRPYYEW